MPRREICPCKAPRARLCSLYASAVQIPAGSTKKEITFVYQKLFLFLSKPQAWYRRSQAHYSVASLLTSPREVRCISSAPMGLYLITRQRASPCGLMIYRNKLRMICKTTFWWYTRLRLDLFPKMWYNTFKRSGLYGKKLFVDLCRTACNWCRITLSKPPNLKLPSRNVVKPKAGCNCYLIHKQ